MQCLLRFHPTLHAPKEGAELRSQWAPQFQTTGNVGLFWILNLESTVDEWTLGRLTLPELCVYFCECVCLCICLRQWKGVGPIAFIIFQEFVTSKILRVSNFFLREKYSNQTLEDKGLGCENFAFKVDLL